MGGKIDPTALRPTIGTSQEERPQQKPRPPVSDDEEDPDPTAPCAGRPRATTESFENGLGEDLVFSSPSSYLLEYERPISGLVSVLVKGKPGIQVTRKLAGACAATASYLFRPSAEAIKGGIRLFHFDAGSYSAIITLPVGGGVVTVHESALLADGGSVFGGGSQLDVDLPADVASQVGAIIDVQKQTLTVVVTPFGRGPVVREHAFTNFGTGYAEPLALRTLSIGNPGELNAPLATGDYVLDNVAIH